MMALRPIFFLCIFLISAALTLEAQEMNQEAPATEFYNKVGLRLGYTGFRFRDEVVNPFLYKGGAGPVELHYAYSTPEFKFNTSLFLTPKDSIDFKTKALDGFSFSGSYGSSIKDTIASLDHKTMRGNYVSLQLNMLWLLSSWKEHTLSLFLGANYNYLVFYKKFITLEYTNLMTDRFNTLGLEGMLEYRPAPKHTFSLGISVPLISYIDRTLNLEYGNETSDARISTFNNYLGVNTNLQYSFHFARRWSLDGGYRFQYYRVKFPRKEHTVYEIFTAGIGFYF